MRYALHSVIRDGAIDDYRLHHERVPDDLVALFERAGIRDWTIWRSGDRLFHLVECDDLATAMRVVGADEADARWQADIGRFVAGFFDSEGAEGVAPLDEVWSLSAQRAAGAT